VERDGEDAREVRIAGTEPRRPLQLGERLDYRVPFRFTGKLARLTIELKPPALSAENQKLLQERGRRNNRASE
jgi:hypothetical protein